MSAMDLALLIVRGILGLIFMVHGSQKLFGAFGGSGIEGTTGMMRRLDAAHPVLLAWLAALSEFGGGLLVFIGLLTPLGAALIISTMLTAIVTVHFKNGFLNTNKGYEFNLSLIALALTLLLVGGGASSVDGLLGITTTFTQLPVWAMIVLAAISFGGVITTEASRSVHHTAELIEEKRQHASR